MGIYFGDISLIWRCPIMLLLIHFMLLVFFYTPWKHQKLERPVAWNWLIFISLFLCLVTILEIIVSNNKYIHIYINNLIHEVSVQREIWRKPTANVGDFLSGPFIMNGDVNGPESPKHTRNGSIKGRIQVALLDDTIVSFDISVKFFYCYWLCIVAQYTSV